MGAPLDKFGDPTTDDQAVLAARGTTGEDGPRTTPVGSPDRSAICTCARLSGDPGSYPCPVHPEFGAATFAGPVIRADDPSAAQDQLVREAFGRCSPSACWSVWGDLARGGITDRKAWDYPIGHLQRLAAELSVIFGQQAPERLREVGVDDARIERLKEALNDGK